MRKNQTREWWEEELAYINSVSYAYPGKSFRGSPYVFGDYCWMQAKFAKEDGFEDIAAAIDEKGRNARNV